MTNKEIVDRFAMQGFRIEALVIPLDSSKSKAAESDPPKPRIDRSLRGPVEVTWWNSGTEMRYAKEDGLHHQKDGGNIVMPWDRVAQFARAIRPIRELEPGPVAAVYLLDERDRLIDLIQRLYDYGVWDGPEGQLAWKEAGDLLRKEREAQR